MYISRYFREEDLNRVAEFIRRHDFATLVTVQGEVPRASHLPVEFQSESDGSWLVNGHMARANPLWHDFAPGKEVLLFFGGPNTYISAAWYNQTNVPTWNYVSVHLYGHPRLIDGGEELRDILSRLVRRHEGASSYRLETLPPDFVDQEIKGTVGFQIRVTRVEAAFKLSQNRSDEDYANIIRQLEQRGDEQSGAIAEEMKKNRRLTGSTSVEN